MDDNQIHAQRRKNNRFLGLVLAAFIILIFLITIAKLRSGHSLEAFDHTIRPSLQQQGDQ